MCGICGIVTKYAFKTEDFEQVMRMNAALAHRGPDGAGEYRDNHIALAMRRLSIIDLAGGWQPLYNEDRSLVLIANGEIYNYIELREQLQKRGHQFSTRSDCETILHIYEEHGVDCVKHLRGMFAFALWDANQRRLVLARDRMGEKPLYLYERDGMLLFASELKAVIRSGAVPFELDPVSVDLYFHYSWVPEPATPIKGVRKLDAAHLLVVDIDPWRIQETCYWRMEDAPPLTGNPGELIRAELETVSKLVIRSDVPVGVALSGGLDSGALAVLAAREYPNTMHAFSVGYPGHPPCDERNDAKAFADSLGMPFHDVELHTSDMVAEFPKMVYWRDDPIADISGYGYYAVMKLAREHNVPVILQGQGGDELFWGYQWVRQAIRRTAAFSKFQESKWRKFLFLLRERLPITLNPIDWYHVVRDVEGYSVFLDEYRYALSRPHDRIFFYDLPGDFIQARNEMHGCYTTEFSEKISKHNVHGLFTFPKPGPALDVLYTKLVCDTYLRENGITQGDRLSMASGIELRLPLLDHRLVETVIGLRKTTPDHNLPPKAWLKTALSGVLSEEIINRPKKGFTPPVHEWYRALFKAYSSDVDGGYLVKYGILSPDGGRNMAKYKNESGIVHPLAFKTLVLEEWCRMMHT